MMNCILAGVGGQGTVLASKLIAQAAIDKGLMARTAETIGMAQRGGCVVSHVRVGSEIHSPMVPLKTADVIVGFEPGETVRCLGYLKDEGTVIVSKKAIKPITASLSSTDYEGNEMIKYLEGKVKNLVVVDGEAICSECGSSKVLNVALLGAAVASGVLNISLDHMENTILKRVPKKYVDMNLKALKLGAKSVTGVNI